MLYLDFVYGHNFCRHKEALDSIGLSRDVWDTLEILTMDAEQALHAEQSFAALPADQKARFKPKISGLDPSKPFCSNVYHRILSPSVSIKTIELPAFPFPEGCVSLREGQVKQKVVITCIKLMPCLRRKHVFSAVNFLDC